MMMTRIVAHGVVAAFLLAVAACSGEASSSDGDGGSGDGGSGEGEGGAGTGSAQATSSAGTGSAGTSSAGTGGAGTGGAGTGGAGTGGSGTGGSACNDMCPAPNGIEVECKSRFMYGVNYAWNNFSADFGGISMWQQKGVSSDPGVHAQKLADMRAHGASVIRWWVFPDFRSDGITFDGNENPTGLGGTAVADIQKALELAEQADVYLMLCLFSFDAFRPSEDVSGLWVPGITPMVTSDAKRAMLMENVVRPLAKAAAASPHKARLAAWDVINEPEWAMSGDSPYGDSDYDPNPELASVTHAQMETFVADTIKVLRQETSALMTVGGAAMKWSRAWSAVDIDFYQFHIYDWVNQYWPYSMSPADYGVDDKPVVMGEFPLAGLSGVSYGDMVNSWYQNGYAGAMGWQYIEASPSQLDSVKAFADSKPCETSY